MEQPFLSNVFKFTDAGGTVSIRQYSDQGYITVEVSDTGCGMSEQTMKRMFDGFVSGDTSHATEGMVGTVVNPPYIADERRNDHGESEAVVFRVRFPVSSNEKEQEGKEQEVIS